MLSRSPSALRVSASTRVVRRPARGFTLTELMVTCFISSLVFLIVMLGWDVTSKTMQNTVRRSVAQKEARAALDDLTRWLRGARPLGACLDTGSPQYVPASECSRPGESGPAIDAYEYDKGELALDFFAYTRANASAASGLGCPRPGGTTDSTPEGQQCPPDLVRVLTGDDLDGVRMLTIERYAPLPYAAGISYTSIGEKDRPSPDDPPPAPGWEATPYSVREVGLISNSALGPFEFIDDDGTPIALKTASIPEKPDKLVLEFNARGDVGVIRMHPTFLWNRAGDRTEQTFTYDTIVALPSSRYARESTL